MTCLALATCLGFILRLTISKLYKNHFINRPELSTPVSDWRRAQEAVFLDKNGFNPYAGNIFHEYPINLLLYKVIVDFLDADIVFAVTDTITALLLGKDNRHVSYVYLLSPISLASCASCSTATFTNFLIASARFASSRPSYRNLTCVLSALLICNNIHFSTLALPIFLMIQTKPSNVDKNDVAPRRSLRTPIAITIAATIGLQISSYFINGGSFSFIESTYLYVLKYGDYKPNIGMFWYFFTEMFENFIDFFRWVVQIMAFVHALPITIALKEHAAFAFYLILLTSTIFQPYQSLAQIGLVICLIPEWEYLIPHMSHRLKYFCAAITCISLWPVFWHLWITMGTANANFYFGVTLGFQLSMVIFMMELIGSFARKHNLGGDVDNLKA